MIRNAQVAMLKESHPVYTGKSEGEVIRIKGDLMAGFHHNLPIKALPYILEELQSARHPYLIASAAYALRGLKTPLPQTVPYLLKAAGNLAHGDDTFFFDQDEHTTALKELFKTIKWHGAYAKAYIANVTALSDKLYLDREGKKLLKEAINAINGDARQTGNCCDEDLFCGGNIKPFGGIKKIKSLVLEDQEGGQIKYGEFFNGKPAVLVFFYSRCDNPDKCSLTITRLAHLQKQLEGKAKIAAITYDAEYDVAHRLKNYGLNRQIKFNNDVRFFRVNADFEQLRAYLDLGVNYIGPYVNKHTIELYVLNSKGEAVASFSRLQWENQEVINKVNSLLNSKKTTTAQSFYSILLSAGMAFFPKCPLCVMAYLSAFGISGMNALWVGNWLFPAMMVLFGINILVLAMRCRTNRFFLPLYLSCTGVVILIGDHLLLHEKAVTMAGLICILAGALTNAWGRRLQQMFGFGLVSA